MACKKCGYKDIKETKIFGSTLCKVCATFAPKKIHEFQEYLTEKLDWKTIDTFRKHGHTPGKKQKEGMQKIAKKGILVTRPPKGYDIIERTLTPNEEASRIHSLYKTFLNRKYSLNSLAKNYGLSVNGIKKILTNRTYLGEIKFAGQIHKADHEPIISPELFYAVQRKLKEHLKK